MLDHHAARLCRRARRVLHVRKVVGPRRDDAHAGVRLFAVALRDPCCRAQRRQRAGLGWHAIQRVRRAEHRGGPHVARDRGEQLQPAPPEPPAGRVDRDWDRAGVEAREKGDRELDARPVRQQDRPGGRKLARQRQGTRVQLAPRETDRSGAGRQERVREAVGATLRVLRHDLAERARRTRRIRHATGPARTG